MRVIFGGMVACSRKGQNYGAEKLLLKHENSSFSHALFNTCARTSQHVRSDFSTRALGSAKHS